MRILDVQPGGGGLIVLSDRRGEELPLSPGTPVLAEVLERNGARVLLELAGRLLRCETSLPLEPGTLIWLAVKEASAGRLVLTPAAPPPDQPAGAVPDGGRPGREGGFLPPETAALVPPALTGEAGAGPSSAISGHDLARAVHYLLANARSTTPEAVESLAPLLAGKANLGEALLRLAALLQQPETGSLLPAGLRQALAAAVDRAVLALPPEASFSPGTLAAQAEALKAVIGGLGLDYEAELARTLLETPLGNLPEMLKGLLLHVRNLLPDLAEEAPTAPAPPSPPPSTAEQAASPLPQLLRAVEDTLHNLTGQRLVAPANPDPATGARLELYLQLPVAVGDRRHTAELRVYREGRRGARREPGGTILSISCRLSTSHLGPVRIDLGLRPAGTTDAHLYLADEQVADLFRTHEPELRAALDGAGLRAGQIIYTVAPPPALPPTGKPSQAGPGGGASGAIDLRL